MTLACEDGNSKLVKVAFLDLNLIVLTFLQLVKAAKTLTGGVTGSIFLAEVWPKT